MPVLSGSECSHSQLLDQQPAYLHYKAANMEEAMQLPPDFKELYDSGMRSFLSVPIATDYEVVGALTIAKEDPGGFEIDW